MLRNVPLAFLLGLAFLAPAAATAAKKKPAPSDDGEPPLPAKIPGPLHCPSPEDAETGEAITVRCATQPGTKPAKVMLHFRGENDAEFTAVAMNKGRNWWTAEIPASATRGTGVQYYVVAQTAAGKVLHADGRRDSPNAVLIKGGASAALTPPAAASGSGAEDDPLALAQRRKVEAERAARDHRWAPGSIWFGLGFGSGYGWHLARRLEFRTDREIQAGFSPATLAHGGLEIGYQYDPKLSFSLQTRHQYIPVDSSGEPLPGTPPKSAHAVLARVRYLLLDFGNLGILGTASLGAGSAFRLYVPARPEQELPGSDTLAGGPVALGPGASVVFHQTKHLAWIAELRVLLGMWEFAAVGDFNVGAAWAF